MSPIWTSPSIYEAGVGHVSVEPTSVLEGGAVLCGDLSEAIDGVAKSNGSDVRGTWLQLMCCTLPKHLCP